MIVKLDKDTVETLRNMIYTAFKIKGYNEEDIVVYPKKKLTKDKLELIFNNWIQVNLDDLNISDIGDEPVVRRMNENVMKGKQPILTKM